jgi:integrase
MTTPTQPRATRGRRGDGSVYRDEKNRVYVGAISHYGPDGKRVRRKVTGRTKSEAQLKLRQLRQELDQGVRTSAAYTVSQAVDDWLARGLDDVAERTRTLYTGILAPVTEIIGRKPLRDLTVTDVRSALEKLTPRYSKRSMQIARNSLERAIWHAMANDRVARNVAQAELLKLPKGRMGRPSKSFTLEQAVKLLEAAKGTRQEAYVTLSLLTGIRTEEARALRWDHVDLDAGTVAVWRSTRAGGDVKTEKSRRTLELPKRAVEALRGQQERQERDRARAGSAWQDHGLVFASRVGTPLTATNVIRAFKRLTGKAGLGEDWTPREMRHTFVSIMSAHGVTVEEIALLAGHQRTATTEGVYRHELRPALTRGAQVMDGIFS